MSVDLNKGATVELVKTLSDDIRTRSDGTIAESAGAAVREKADPNGVFESMTAGASEQLLSDEVVEDSVPYVFRKTNGIATKMRDEIVGGTIAWNQLVNTGSASVTVQSGHKYLSKVNNVQTIGASTGSAISINDASADNVFDLTQMFGSAVADYIYGLEQANAGAGVAFFRSLFPQPYYAYNAGELLSVSDLVAHQTVGFNLFNKDTVQSGKDVDGTGAVVSGSNVVSEMFKVLPNTEYYVKNVVPATIARGVVIYDAAGSFINAPMPNNKSSATEGIITTRSNARFMIISTGQSTNLNTVCVNISDSAKNGTYEPYVKHSYPLDSSLTLRGVPKLVNNKVKFDGDIYKADGTVTRRYGIRAYQSGDDSLADAITDGTNTVYKLSTPTSETAEPFTELQTLDKNGTEEYVANSIVPVGHNTKYYVDLKGKIEGLPSDFSTLIAPTEAGYKATQNYTVNDLVIVNNILYKVTANIANGGTITPNTNVTQTTLSALIKALSA